MPKTIFIAHPVSGDVEGNLRKIVAICRSIHSQNHIPVFPSFTWRKYLDDSEQSRELAGTVNLEYFRRRMIDEVWLYGDHMSDGMHKEVLLAWKYGAIVAGKTPATKKALAEMQRDRYK